MVIASKTSSDALASKTTATFPYMQTCCDTGYFAYEMNTQK